MGFAISVYYGTLVLILAYCTANCVWQSRFDKTGCGRFAPITASTTLGSLLTAIGLAAFGVVSSIHFVIYSLVLPDDARTIIAVGGGALYVAAAFATASTRIPSWVAIVLLVVGTCFLMQGAQLRFYVGGSRYDYNAAPYGDWALQGVMLSISIASVYANRRKGSVVADA